MNLGLDGKVALVTAASKGLGKASAQALAAEGCKIVICARGEEALHATATELDAYTIVSDVTQPDEPARLVAATVERFGGIDILVANAGGPPPMRALEVDDEALAAAINANLTTSVRLVRASAAAHAGQAMGPHLLHHIVVDQAADPHAGVVEPGPDRPVGVGQDGGRRPVW